MTEPGRAESAAALAQCPRLAAGEPFDFVCAGCGDCCRNRRDLVLSGYDLYRIARRLGLPPRLTADAFCKQEFAPQTLLPAVVLRPNARTGNCPFFEADACTIHAARPLACALYPLGQAIDPATAAMEYYVQLPLCGARVSTQEQRTLQNYLDDAAITARAGIDARCVPSFRISCSRQADAKTRATSPPPAALHAPCILIIPSRMIFTPSSTPTPRRFGRCWIKCCEINHQRLGKRDIDGCKNKK